MLHLCLALAALQDGGTFESAEYGVKLDIPAGWNIDATREPRVILKLNRAGDFAFKPELVLYEVRPGEPVTLAQHKEVVREFIQRAYRDPRILDERNTQVAGRPAFIFMVTSKGQNDAAALSFRGVVQLSPYRLVAVDGVFPQAQGDVLAKSYDDLLARVTFIDRKPPAGTDEGLKNFAEAAGKLKAWAAADNRKDELEIAVNDKVIGSYSLTLTPGNRGAVPGVVVESEYKVDLGDEGRLETRVTGFLSDDLATQSVEVEQIKTNKEKRTMSFLSNASLAKGEIVATHTINGEKASARVKAPERTVFYELAAALQARLLADGKSIVSVPVVSAFETEIGYTRLETTGTLKLKDGDVTFDGQASSVLREDGAVMTSWFDDKRTLIRVTVSGQPFVMRKKK